MKILFVWTGVTSYMADCWRALQRCAGVELRLAIVRRDSGGELDAPRVLAGLDWSWRDDSHDGAVAWPDWEPDVIFAVGWHGRVVRETVRSHAGVPKICCLDMPWRRSLRCLAARWVLRPFLAHYSAALVAGSSAARYARWLGFGRIRTGVFALRLARFAAAFRVPRAERRGFLYVGRAAREKRLDVLVRAWRRYRAAGGAWTLDLAGGAGLAAVAEAAGEGVRYLGFVTPVELPGVYARHGALVLASDFDPWPLVVLEARAAGLAIVASERATCWPELVPPGAGAVVPAGDEKAFAAAMAQAEAGAFAPPPPATLAYWDCETWVGRALALAGEVARA